MPGTASFTTQQTEQGAPSNSRDNASDDRVKRESGSFDTSASGRGATTIKTEEDEIKAESFKVKDDADSEIEYGAAVKQEEERPIPLA
ncbi:hypothetical protein QFC24_006629 [Naganishia onofrii]|uniref:Uncharacterized protein n=1 Tax=Naganishia onofrii TaxID=1851511 RepID=A0ACC2X079_9TREE|nr:hypothetical protein QFC24_006629 [Naganishia onofrii]